jgi:hypothetical protein
LIVCGLPAPSLVTVIVAFRAPAAAGVNVRPIVQLAPALTVAQLELTTVNSAGALLVTLDTVTAVPPVLVTVTLFTALVVPTVCVPKVTVAGIESWPGAVVVPVPLTLIVCGLPTPLLVTLIVPVRTPAAAGVKVSVIVQLAAGLTVVHPELDTPNSVGALLAMPDIVTAVPPVLVTVTLFGALVAPTSCAPNETELAIDNWPGLALATPLPITSIACGLPTPLLVTVIVPLRAPAAAGVKVRLIVQVAPALMVVQSALDAPNSEGALLVMLETVTAAPLLFVTTTLRTALVVPTVWSAKVTEEGIDNETTPVPLIGIVTPAP